MQEQTDAVVLQGLLAAALAALAHAHAPYSAFATGAALLLWDGSVLAGCNVENASYGLTVCAERVAVQRAVAEGRLAALLADGGSPGGLIRAVAVVGDLPQPLTPCGACRQVLAEFAGPDCIVYCANVDGRLAQYTLGELLPAAFALPG